MDGKSYKAYTPSFESFLKRTDIDHHVLEKVSEAEVVFGNIKQMLALFPYLQDFRSSFALQETYDSLRSELGTTTLGEYHKARVGYADHKAMFDHMTTYHQTIITFGNGDVEMFWNPEQIHSFARASTGNNLVAGFRKKQTWVGGTHPTEAQYVPAHATDLEHCMHELCTFIAGSYHLPSSMKASLAFAYTLLLLPYDAHNARLARLFWQCLIEEYQLCDSAMLLPSRVIMGAAKECNDHILGIYHKAELTSWYLFFLDKTKVIAEQTLMKLMELREETERYRSKLHFFGKAMDQASKVMDAMPGMLFFTINDIIAITGLSKPNAGTLVQKFIRLGLASQIDDAKRNRVFCFTPLHDIIAR